MQPEFLSKRSVAAFFDTSVTTVSRWVERGILPKPIIIGGTRVIEGGQERVVGGAERWPVSSLIQAACGAMDRATQTGASSTDAEEATERAIHAAREGRKAKAGGRNR